MTDGLTPQGWIEKCAEILTRTTIPDRPYRPGGVVASVILHEYRAYVASQPLAGLAERISMKAWDYLMPMECGGFAGQEFEQVVSTHLEPIGEVLRECRNLLLLLHRQCGTHCPLCVRQDAAIAKLDALLGTKGGSNGKAGTP